MTRDTTLMLDSEWEAAYIALPDYARRAMQATADLVGTKIRLLDPGDYANTPKPPPTPAEIEQQRAAEIAEIRRQKRLNTPVNIPPELPDWQLKEQAERLGVTFENFKQAHNEQRARAQQAEAERKEALKLEATKVQRAEFSAKVEEALANDTGAGLVILAIDKQATPEQKDAIVERLGEVWPAGLGLV